MEIFKSYHDWHLAITVTCGISLTKTYCQERIAALMNEKAPGTKPFIDTYGVSYRDQVVSWFRQALNL